VIVWLGWINADFVSQAQLAGWTLHGIPWDRAMGQLILTIATFAVPLFRGTNVYCSHVCPHGALQQVVRNRIPWQLKLSARASRVLKMLPVGLLLLVLAGAFGLISLRPVDLEPFDAWAWGIAGTATVTIAVVGLTFSLIVPMGYCRFGCPTGSLLDWLSTRSDRWSAADTFSVILLCVSLALVVL
jgi:polyferredoxin